MGEDGGGFTAVLCAVIDHMIQAVPQDAVAWFAVKGNIFLVTFHIFIGQSVEIGTHGLLFDLRPFNNGLNIGKVFWI